MKTLKSQNLGPPTRSKALKVLCLTMWTLRPRPICLHGKTAATEAVLSFFLLLGVPLIPAQTLPTLIQQVISREVVIDVGGVQAPECKELVSREFAVVVGDESLPPMAQATSREISVVVMTPSLPKQVAPLVMTPSSSGDVVTLSWAGYNEWAEKDVARYDVYISTRGFNNVLNRTRIAWVPGETFSITLTNLPVWEDHFFAVVAVDALGRFDRTANSAGVYLIAKELITREFSMFVGEEPEPSLRQSVSYEASIVVTTPARPRPVTNLTVAASPSGDLATLSWIGYNEWAERDITFYDIYVSDHGFTNVNGMTWVVRLPAETFTLSLTNLSPWADHFFAVAPVDALGGFNPAVIYASALVSAREVVSREFTVFVGAEPDPAYRQVASHEVSIVVSTPEIPAIVTCLRCGFTARDSVNSFSSLDLDWTAYNELGQRDVVGYRVYLSSIFFDEVSALSPFMYVPAETKHCTVTGLDPYGIYYVAVVAEDVKGQINSIVRSQSAQSSVDQVREVRNLTAICETKQLAFSWNPPTGADPNTNNLLSAYYLYFGGNHIPVVLDRWTTNYTATELQPGHGYPVVIHTLDISNRLSAGASLLAATLAPNPSQTAIHSFYGITRVSWERLLPDEVIEGFLVYLSETNITNVARLSAAQFTRGHSADFTNLVDGKTYYFAVITKNIAGCDSFDLPLKVKSHAAGGLTPPTELRIPVYFNEAFAIEVNGPLGAKYVLQSSTNLVDWISSQTNVPAILPTTLIITNGPPQQGYFRILIQ